MAISHREARDRSEGRDEAALRCRFCLARCSGWPGTTLLRARSWSCQGVVPRAPTIENEGSAPRVDLCLGGNGDVQFRELGVDDLGEILERFRSAQKAAVDKKAGVSSHSQGLRFRDVRIHELVELRIDRIHAAEGEVVEDQQIGPQQLAQQLLLRVAGPSLVQLLEQAIGADEQDVVAGPACGVAERRGQVSLSYSRLPL